jgi:hypothetical protein
MLPQWCPLCLVETPEGPACGLIKAFALGARVTLLPGAAQLNGYRESVMSQILPHPQRTDSHFVLLNGEIIGYTDDPDTAVQRLRNVPPPGQQPYYSPSVCVSVTDGTIHIHTEDGRVVRPLLIPSQLPVGVENAAIDELLRDKMLRYVDAAEISTMEVAMSPRSMHWHSKDLMEVHAHLILGVTAALIPMLQANQSPRNAYQTSMVPRASFPRKRAPGTTGGGWDPATRAVRRVTGLVLCPETAVCRDGPKHIHGCHGMRSTDGAKLHHRSVPVRSCCPLEPDTRSTMRRVDATRTTRLC